MGETAFLGRWARFRPTSWQQRSDHNIVRQSPCIISKTAKNRFWKIMFSIGMGQVRVFTTCGSKYSVSMNLSFNSISATCGPMFCIWIKQSGNDFQRNSHLYLIVEKQRNRKYIPIFSLKLAEAGGYNPSHPCDCSRNNRLFVKRLLVDTDFHKLGVDCITSLKIDPT